MKKIVALIILLFSYNARGMFLGAYHYHLGAKAEKSAPIINHQHAEYEMEFKNTLGADQASDQTKKEVRKAIQLMGVKKASKVPVYRLDNRQFMGPFSIVNGLSRAPFGIWIINNSDYVSFVKRNSNEKNEPFNAFANYYHRYLIYHEAAHYALKHAYDEKLYNNFTYEAYESTEKEADNLAVKTLCNNGHFNVVNFLANHCSIANPSIGSHCYNIQKALKQWKTQQAKELNDKKDLLLAMAK